MDLIAFLYEITKGPLTQLGLQPSFLKPLIGGLDL